MVSADLLNFKTTPDTRLTEDMPNPSLKDSMTFILAVFGLKKGKFIYNMNIGK